jgi:hypothetical protein
MPRVHSPRIQKVQIFALFYCGNCVCVCVCVPVFFLLYFSSSKASVSSLLLYFRQNVTQTSHCKQAALAHSR